MFVTSTLNSNAEFYRGRKIWDSKFFSDLEQLTLKKPEYITSYGRCHIPKQPVLYASHNLETVYSELGLDIGDKVQTIKIKLKDGEKIKFSVIGEIDHIRRHGKPALVSDELAQNVRDHWSSINELDKLRLNITDAFFADMMMRPVKYEYEYKITSAISNVFFKDGYDAFYYPSVSHLGGWNIVITEQAFKDKFEVIETEKKEIYNVLGYGIFGAYSINTSQKINNETIAWEEEDKKYPIFNNFDQYINYGLALSGIKTLIFCCLKFISIEVPEKIRENLKEEEAKKNVAFNKIEKISFEGSAPLTIDLNFENLVRAVDKKNNEWDVVAVDIMQNDNDIPKSTLEMREKIKKGYTKYSIFNRDGHYLLLRAVFKGDS